MKNLSKWPAKIKLEIAIEAIKAEKTIVQIASERGLHPKQVQRWRDLLLDEGEGVFLDKRSQKAGDPDKEKLLHIIATLTEDLDFLKKKLKKLH